MEAERSDHEVVFIGSAPEFVEADKWAAESGLTVVPRVSERVVCAVVSDDARDGMCTSRDAVCLSQSESADVPVIGLAAARAFFEEFRRTHGRDAPADLRGAPADVRDAPADVSESTRAGT